MDNDQKSQQTAVLLPAARVKIFTRDVASRAAFERLSADWRFARVQVEAHDGDVDDAIKTFQTEISPDLVLIQTEEINDAFTAKLETLAAHCATGTAAIVIGPVNDVNLYRRLIGMGVSDYLVRPLRTEILSNDIAATLLEKVGAGDSHLIACLGAKGGVGVSTVAQGLAWGVAERLGQKTFLLDAAGGWSSLSVGMNFEPATTLKEAARAAVEKNADSFGRMLFPAHENLTVLSSGGDVMLDDGVTPAAYETLLETIMVKYPVVIVDLSGASAALKRLVLTRAQEILLVATPTLPAIRAARTLMQEIKTLRGNSDTAVDLVVNMAGLAKAEVNKAQIAEGMGREIAANLPFAPDLFVRTEGEGKRLLDQKDGAPLVEQLLTLARKVVPSKLPAAGPVDAGGAKGLGRFAAKLKTKRRS